MKTLKVTYVLNDPVTIKELNRPGIIRGVRTNLVCGSPIPWGVPLRIKQAE